MQRARRKTGKGEAWTYGMDSAALWRILQDQNLRSHHPLGDLAHEEIYRLALRDLLQHGETIQQDSNTCLGGDDTLRDSKASETAFT
ncbi:inner nuclear membrane protein enriched at telomere/subtelomere region [Microbotryomycetes sp. JL221]|nr:inner nuclear membrane protein enriched at telomere/subtelomere region [Microbotryomycetes sp. JL221]